MSLKKPPIIFTSAFIMSFATNMLLFAIVFHVKSVFEASVTMASGLLACYNIFYVLACISAQKLVSRIAPQQCLKISMTMLAAGSALAYFACGIWMSYTGVALCGIATAFFWPPLMGWLSEGLEGKELSRYSGLYNMSWSVASMLGPALSGFLCDFNVSIAMLLVFAIYFITWIYFIIAYRRCTRTKAADKSSPANEKGSGYETKMRYICWIGLFAGWFLIGFINGVFPYAAEDILEISRTKIGILMTIRSLAMTVAVTGLGFVNFWQYKWAQLFIGHIVMGLATLTLCIFHNEYLLALSMLIIGLAQGQTYINSLFHGVAGSKNRTLRMSIHESTLAIGTILGSAVCGILLQRYSYSCTVIVTAAFFIIAIVADLVYRCQTK